MGCETLALGKMSKKLGDKEQQVVGKSKVRCVEAV